MSENKISKLEDLLKASRADKVKSDERKTNLEKNLGTAECEQISQMKSEGYLEILNSHVFVGPLSPGVVIIV